MHSAPLATISLAANILQFIDWVSEAIQVAENVRDKGTGSAFAISVYDASEVLRYQISRLVVNDRISCDTKSDYTARKIATECSKLAQKLLNFAETLQVKEEDSSFSEQECLMTGMPKKWEKFQRKYLSAKKTLNKEGTTFAKALRFMWNKKTISLLIEQIDNYRKLMCSEVLIGIRESVAETIETMHRISHDQVAGHHQSAVAQKESENTLLDALGSHSDELFQQLAALEQSSRDREMKILSAIQTFVKTVEKGGSYPVLPVAVMGYDPSISSNAHNKGRLIESSVLSQLQFRRMHAREAEVKDAYAKTCCWIFEQTEFSEWLEEGQGIYWISGKAGCGKSTLMKLVVSDPRTRIALRRWCAQSSLHVESYFFWFGGSELQKNQEGLLRSLLHGILSRVSELIPRAFPEMYNAMMARLLITNETPETFFQCDQPGCGHIFRQQSRFSYHLRKAHLSSSTLQDSTYSDQLNEGCGILTLTELKSALLFVVSELPKDLKLCLFIDGLDEYSGNHRDIIDLFRLLVARSYNVKAVVSSRPEPIFIESFTPYPQNRMEELTSQDIDHYVRSHLLQHRRMVSLRLWNQDGVETLFMSVVKRSCGVFLWVFLVTRALLDGLNDGSSLSELHQISEDYPDELQKVYEHMLDRMTPRHRLHGLQLLLCISIAQDTEDSLPSLLRLSFINQAPELALTAKLLQKSPDDLQDTLESMENRLRNRCCGLIEVGSFKACGEIKFLHRTVAEFLRTMATMMRDETEKSGFRPYVALISSTIMSFKAWEFFTISPEVSFVEVYGPTLRGFFHHCGQMLEGAGQSTWPGAYIYELDRILTHFWNHRCLENMPGKTARSHWVDGMAGMRRKRLKAVVTDPLVFLASEHGLVGVLQRHRQLMRRQASTETVSHDQSATELVNPPWSRAARSEVARLNYYAASDARSQYDKPSKPQKLLKGPEENVKLTPRENKVTSLATCMRCKATQELTNMGFSCCETREALDMAGIGTDVSALTAWLLDRQMQDSLRTASPNSSRVAGSKSVKPADAHAAQQWSTVAKRAPRAVPDAVPGFVVHEAPDKKKKKVYRPRRQPKQEATATSGELHLSVGTLTWFLDTHGSTGGAHHQKQGLSTSDECRLTECVNEMLQG